MHRADFKPSVTSYTDKYIFTAAKVKRSIDINNDYWFFFFLTKPNERDKMQLQSAIIGTIERLMKLKCRHQYR